MKKFRTDQGTLSSVQFRQQLTSTRFFTHVNSLADVSQCPKAEQRGGGAGGPTRTLSEMTMPGLLLVIIMRQLTVAFNNLACIDEET